MNYDNAKVLASVLRDWLALAFTPVVTGILIWLIAILAFGGWDRETQVQRIYFLGVLAIINAALVGLGGQWFQRNRLATLKGTAPGGTSFDLTTAPDLDPVEPSPATAITTVTTTTVPQPAGQV